MPAFGTKDQLTRLNEELKETFAELQEQIQIFITNSLIEHKECTYIAQTARMEALDKASLLQDRIYDLLGGEFEA